MTIATSDAAIVLFRGGFSAPAIVVQVLNAIEARGARFELLPGGKFRVIPAAVLTEDDVVFLQAHRDDARRVLEYQADDTHLFRDTEVT